MKDNIINIDRSTTLDIDPDKILGAAIGELNSVVVVGFDKNNRLYMATSLSDMFETNYLLDKYKQLIMNTEQE